MPDSTPTPGSSQAARSQRILAIDLGKLKIDMLTADKPDIVGAVDMACMMHLSGIAQKQGRPLNKLHVAEILMAALRPAPKQSPQQRPTKQGA